MAHMAERMQRPPTYRSPTEDTQLHWQSSSWNERLPTVSAVPPPPLLENDELQQKNSALLIMQNECSGHLHISRPSHVHPSHQQRSAWNERLLPMQAVEVASSRKPLPFDGVRTPQLNPRLFMK